LRLCGSKEYLDCTSSDKKADITASLIILVIITCLFIPTWIQGLTTILPSYQDETQWYLYRLFINQSFASGRFPLWCPHLYAGLNFAGWGHGSAFYPPGIIFYLWQYVNATPLNQWFHLLLGSLGLYYLARVIRVRPFASCLGALWFGLGHLVPSFQENFLPRVFVMGFSPWIYAFLYQVVHTRRIKFLVLAGVSMGAQWLSGHIEVIVLQDVVIGLGFMALLVTRYRGRPGVILIFAAAFIIGVALGLLQFLPALEETNRSFRSIGFDYPLFRAFTMPRFWIEAWLFWLSIGNLFTLLFIVYALARIRSDRRVLLIAGLIFLILTITFNWFNILWVVYRIPLLNRFIPHGRMLAQAFMLMALLVGIGLDHVQGNLAKSAASRVLSVVLLIETTAAILLLQVFHLHEKIQTDPVARDVIAHFFQARLFASWVIGIIAILFLVLSFMRRSPRIGTLMLGIVLALEFIPTAFAHLPQRPKTIMDYNHEYIRFFKAQKDRARSLIVYPFDRYHELDIPLQSGVLYGTDAPDAYITLSTLRYTEFMSLLDPRSYRLSHGKIADIQTPNILKRGDFIGPETIPFINLLNLRFIVSRNRNIKDATHYFLAYETDRFSPVSGQARRINWNDLELLPPATFGLDLYFRAGDHLRLGISAPGKTRPGPILLEVAELSESGGRRVLFEKMLEIEPGELAGNFDISLEDIWARRTTLCISAKALARRGPDRLILVRPHIYNPDKHFVRLNLSEVNIFRNPTAMSRAFLVHDYRIIPDCEARLEFMRSPEFKPDRLAVLEADPGLEIIGTDKSEGSGKMRRGEGVLIERYESDEVMVMVRAQVPGMLLLSDQYAPGWRVWVDRKEQVILPADHAFRAVKVEPGYHLVHFRYQPKSFIISLYFAIISWLGILGLIAIARLGNYRARSRAP